MKIVVVPSALMISQDGIVNLAIISLSPTTRLNQRWTHVAGGPRGREGVRRSTHWCAAWELSAELLNSSDRLCPSRHDNANRRLTNQRRSEELPQQVMARSVRAVYIEAHNLVEQW